nr:T9SS type A sorting domain-containing protein [Candidatus Bipolaricaulota bacterium]
DDVRFYGYPNPAATQATFLYYLPDGATSVAMAVYSAMTGSQVFEATLPVDQVTYTWDLATVTGAPVGNGLYLCVIRVTNNGGGTTRSEVYKLLVSR